MTIREATGDDLTPAEELSRAAFAELRDIYAPSASARAHAADTSEQFTRLIAVHRDNRVAGTLQFAEEGDRIHVRALAVHRDARRRGVARALVERVREIAAERSKRAVSLYTVAETGNPGIFERLGLQVVWLAQSTDLELAAGGQATEVYMERRLRG